ncbi:hypothetical protein OHC33_010414 [Knufia fluminis]|uniref:Uncharacterized protein n=1 Tax=Knufia fluminis TaxID=191047 RepID=A0AAN8ED09_9EURO|nr:hypothetical protein OHC33_010414 [Knufia fluminis]
MSSQTLRLVHKTHYNTQIFHPLATPSTTLPPSTLRIRTSLLGLGSNNLSYCAAGDLLHWWDAYPPPTDVDIPAPHNDTDLAAYGIAPGWGYATVLDSTIPEIAAGRILYGFIPISGHAVDLTLRRVEGTGFNGTHWIEVSEQRAKVMNLYQRYMVMPDTFSLPANDSKQGAKQGQGVHVDPLTLFTPVLKPVWEAGWLLARYVFAQSAESTPDPVHPLGEAVSPWSAREADLSDACIVCVASGTKTARSFLEELARIALADGKGEKPSYSVLEVTGGKAGCERYIKDVPFQHELVGYDEIGAEVFKKQKYRKYVLLNFGGRDNALARVGTAIKEANPDAETVCVQIGGEAKVYSGEELAVRRETAEALGAVQMNTTGIRDEVMRRVGEEKYFGEMNGAFEKVVREQIGAFDGAVLGVRVKVSEGLRGEDGLEGCWERLCAGGIAGDEGLVVRLGA